MSQSYRIRESYVDFVIDIKPNLALTLGDAESINLITFEDKVRHFLNLLQHRARGRNWSKWPVEQRPRAIGFNEKPEINPHMHLAVWAPEDLVVYFKGGRSAWREVRRAGDYYCEEIKDVERYARYITKELRLASANESVFVYQPSDNRRIRFV